MSITIAGTGHRPDKLGGYTEAARLRAYDLARAELTRIRPSTVISGMALGWDQALAEAALDLKIPLHAYIPFKGQESRWPDASRQRYDYILRRASHKVIVCQGDYASWMMSRRNEAMVDACDAVLALWNGSSGGTANCVFYAKKRGKRIENCWDRFVKGTLQRNLELAP